MRLRTKGAWLLAGAACTIGFVVWPGCATPPLPSSRVPLSWHQPSNFHFTKNAHPTRSEIIDKLGPPDSYFSDVRVAAYKLNVLKRKRLTLLLGILPIDVSQDADRLEVALIQFDEKDRVQRSEVIAVPIEIQSAYPFGYITPATSTVDTNISRQEVTNWLAKPSEKKH